MVTAARIRGRRTFLQIREPGWHSSMLSPCLSSCASLLPAYLPSVLVSVDRAEPGVSHGRDRAHTKVVLLRHGFVSSVVDRNRNPRQPFASEWTANQRPCCLLGRRGLRSSSRLSRPNEPILTSAKGPAAVAGLSVARDSAAAKSEKRTPPSMPSAACGALRALSAAPGAPASSGPALPTSLRVSTPSALPTPRQFKPRDWPVMSRARRTRQQGRVMLRSRRLGPQRYPLAAQQAARSLALASLVAHNDTRATRWI